MARPVSSDFLHSFRFHVTAAPTQVTGVKLLGETGAQAGFSAVTIPSSTIAVAEYREGQYVYTRKQPGIPSMSDITLSRGVALKDTVFYTWYRICVQGTGEYRTDLTITHFQREPALQGSSEGLDIDSPVNRKYTVFEAFPTGLKPATDLDGTATEISISELTIGYEKFEIGDTTA